MNWEIYFKLAKENYFTPWIMELASLVAIIISLLRKEKSKDLKYLFIICIASFIETILGAFHRASAGKFLSPPWPLVIDTSYEFIEFFSSLFFINTYIRSPLGKKIIFLSPFALFFFIIIIYLLKTDLNYLINGRMNIMAIEGFLLIISCLYFFYEVLTVPIQNQKTNQPALWGVGGILIFFSTTSPFYIFGFYLSEKSRQLYNKLYVINYIAYCIMFSAFAIAFYIDKKKIKLFR